MNTHVRLLILGLVLGTSTAYAGDVPARSLFLSKDDAVLAEQMAADAAKPGSADIALDAIMYMAPDDWAVWLQGKRRTPANRAEPPAISEVNADRVVLTLPGEDGAVDKTVSLRPGERYQLADGAITHFQRLDR